MGIRDIIEKEFRKDDLKLAMNSEIGSADNQIYLDENLTTAKELFKNKVIDFLTWSANNNISLGSIRNLESGDYKIFIFGKGENKYSVGYGVINIKLYKGSRVILNQTTRSEKIYNEFIRGKENGSSM